MTAVQDLGRFGSQSLGVPVSGALDTDALRLANVMVGNDPSAAALEIRMMGPTIRVEAGQVRVALVGTKTPIEVLGGTAAIIPAGHSVILATETVFRVGAVKDSGVCYLAVEGSFAITPELGSLSTYLPGKMGGVEGRPLMKGDVLPVAGDRPVVGSERRINQGFCINDDDPIRVVLGPQDDWFTASSLQTFLNTDFIVSPKSNRMGMHLDGAVLEHAKGYNIASDGIVAGSIQVPGNGSPIILLADRQTTGGYPKIASVISADLPRLGRKLPGQTIRFSAVDVPEAEALRREAETRFWKVVNALEDVQPSLDSFDARLIRENLISGVVGEDGQDD